MRNDHWLTQLAAKMTYEATDAEETRRCIADLRPRLDQLLPLEWHQLDMRVRALCCRAAAAHRGLAYERARMLLVAKLCDAQASLHPMNVHEYAEAQGDLGAAAPRAQWASCWAYTFARQGDAAKLSADILAMLARGCDEAEAALARLRAV